jgi:hypothetical protein
MQKIIVQKGQRRLEFDVEGLMVDDTMDTRVYELGQREPQPIPGPWPVSASGKAREKVHSEVLWQNECMLVIGAGPNRMATGEMGLCYPDERSEVQVEVRLINTPTLVEKIRKYPVRITIEMVPGGNR